MKLTFSIITTFLIIIASSCGQSEKASKITQFPKRIGVVNDFDNIFSDKEEKILDSLIENFKSRTTSEISIVSIDENMTTLEGFNSYTLRLANAWGVGKKKNGILIGISASLQRVRINKGLGVEKALTDTKTKKILAEFVFPEFRKGNYFEGTRVAIMELAKILDK